MLGTVGLLLLCGCQGDDDRAADEPSAGGPDLTSARASAGAASSALLDDGTRGALLDGRADSTVAAQVVRLGTGTDDPAGGRAAAALLGGLQGVDADRLGEPLSDAVLDTAVVWAARLGTSGGIEGAPVAAFAAGAGAEDAVRVWSAVRAQAQGEVTRAMADGSSIDGALRRAGTLDGQFAEATVTEGGGSASAAVAAGARWSAAAWTGAEVVATGSGPTVLLEASPERWQREIAARLEQVSSALEGGTAATVLERVRLEAPAREQQLVADSALAAGDDLAVPADALESAGAVPRLAPGAPAETVEAAYDVAKDLHDVDEGGYADAFVTSFVPRT